MQFFVKREVLSDSGTIHSYYWTGHEWNADYIPAKDYKTKGNANRVAKILARHHNDKITSITWK